MKLAVVALVVACKADAPPERDPRIASGDPAVVQPAPARAEMPIIDGAKQLASTTKHGTRNDVWCLDQPDAVERIKAALAREGWAEVRSRGKPERQGVSARRGELRFSAVASTGQERCAGTYVVATLIKIGAVDVPPLQDGERIR
jgi:hypothetical protein